MQVYFLLISVAVFAVVSEARPQSECEKHRDNAKKIPTVMKMIPDCDDDGHYKPMQCYHGSSFCMCYSKDGKPISPSSTKLNDCRCYLKRQEKMSRGHDNAFVPQCEDTGAFSKKQLWDYNNSCWCVDEDGNQKGDIKSNCDSLQCD